MDASRGVVRWRIASGILVARRGREGDGYLEIDVQRRPAGAPGQVIVHVEVEVANFFPAIASTIGRWFYTHTQSRIHVLVTQAFLHSLAAPRPRAVEGRAPGDLRGGPRPERAAAARPPRGGERRQP